MKKILMTLSALSLIGLGIFFLSLLCALVPAREMILVGREIILLVLGSASFTFGLYLLGSIWSSRRK